MKALITIFFVLLIHSFCKAQTDSAFSITNKKVNDKIIELKNDKAGTIVCYFIYCITGAPRLALPDSCLAYDIKYLLWSKHGKHYIQRFDECKEHNPSSLNSTFFVTLNRNYSNIYKTTLKELMSVDHFCSTKIEIYTGDTVLRKRINWPDLDKYWYGRHLNKNYIYNQKSVLNKLKTLAERDIGVYNKNH